MNNFIICCYTIRKIRITEKLFLFSANQVVSFVTKLPILNHSEPDGRTARLIFHFRSFSHDLVFITSYFSPVFRPFTFRFGCCTFRHDDADGILFHFKLKWLAVIALKPAGRRLIHARCVSRNAFVKLSNSRMET